MDSVERWVRKIETTKVQEIKRNSIKILRLLVRELLSSFPSAASMEVERSVKIRVPELAGVSGDAEEPPSPTLRRSIDGPVEFRQKSGLAAELAAHNRMERS